MEEKVIYKRLSDEDILRLSEGRVITSYGDFDLSRGQKFEKNRLYPVVGGVYDSHFFGSVYTDSCNCGRTHVVGRTCPTCGSLVLDEESKYKRYARIELEFYYVRDTELDGLVELMSSLPLNLTLAKDEFGFSRLGLSSTPQVCELCQFDWNDELEEIIVTPEITDETHASYEGLELIIKDQFPDLYENFKSLVNKYVLVVPAAYRMATFNPYDAYTKLSIPIMSSIYQAIVRLKYEVRETLANSTYTPSERVALKATLRRYCAKSPYWLSSVLRTSKETITRQVLSARIDDSGRAPIVGDPTLEIDQVKLPIHLAYELFRVDFIAYLAELEEISPEKAELKYTRASKEVLDKFAEYCKRRRVIMNRPPSLHRYNNMSFRVLLTTDQAIHFPPTSVVPFAADFDGDMMSFFAIPEEFNDLFDKNASPATQLKYESTGGFIWEPNQDMLYGLILATRVIPTKEDEDTKLKYISLEDAEKDYSEQIIEYPTDHIIMNGKITSYSREKVGQIIGKSIDDLYGEGEYINGKNISTLLAYLYGLPDFTTRYRDLVQFGLEVITLEGATVPSLREMISVDTSSFTAELKELIAKSEKDPRYYVELDREYKKFVENQVNNMSEDLTRRVKDSGRMKMSQILEMMVPQMTVNYKGEYYVATNSLVNGLSREDYVHHAINNRAILQMKQAVTPKGGYLNRQLIFAGQGVRMDRSGVSDHNEGVWIPRNRAAGRTTLDDEVLEPSDSTEMVLVKSYAVEKSGIMTPDLISEDDTEFEDGSNIGLKITSAVAGSVTQAGLSLKHTGTLRKLDDHLELKARYDCKVRRLTIDTLEITLPNKAKITHFIPEDFVMSNDSGKFKKGDIIGFKPDFTDPGVKSKCIIDLLGGMSTDDIGKNHPKDFALNVTPVGGRIHYDQDYINIGNVSIPRDPSRIYYYFEGDEVDPYTIICDGVLDCTNIIQYCDKLRDYYGCFRSYFRTLLPQLNEQTLEYVFTTINTYDENGDVHYTGIRQKVRDDKSIMTNLGFEGSTRVVRNILSSSEPIVEDQSQQRDLINQFYLTILADNNNDI